ncbi:YqcI/YcgG family protein [Streptomyces sulphureus]|uniref:YqcI/YcgG family protein n=1 Tax=Streptomyces sulphureus TaxID=47758 RepID=UPI0009988D22|nr:YqcI/YcgG family protein [Streptomyces sulphureus]
MGDIPEWGSACVRELREVLLSAESPFPCTFAVAGVKRDGLRFGFVDSLDDEKTWGRLGDLLTGYLERYRDLGRETSLVVFFRQEGEVRSLSEYNERFWSVLQHLHDTDTRPWPAEVPRDSDEAWWEFSFGGTPIFVVCNTPAHRLRRSRHSPVFFITFQPRWVFEELGADTPAGAAARRTIRKRLHRYDAVPASPELGSYGDPDNREWRQYFLPDGADEAGAEQTRCPFRHRAADGAVARQPTGESSTSRRTPKMVGES